MNYKEYTVRVYSDGTKEWRQNGKLHREDGPASEYANGTKYWYRNGKLHREDGPAIEYADGAKYWYLNGVLYFEKRFQEKMSSKQNCEGTKNVTSLLVEIDGKKYKLAEV